MRTNNNFLQKIKFSKFIHFTNLFNFTKKTFSFNLSNDYKTNNDLESSKYGYDDHTNSKEMKRARKTRNICEIEDYFEKNYKKGRLMMDNGSDDDISSSSPSKNDYRDYKSETNLF
jgi:hypothetical protein